MAGLPNWSQVRKVNNFYLHTRKSLALKVSYSVNLPTCCTLLCSGFMVSSHALIKHGDQLCLILVSGLP